MKHSETTILLSKIAAFDQRTIGVADVEAWSEVLTAANVELVDAMSAVADHFGQTSDRLMPAQLIKLSKTSIRKRRLRDAGVPPMPGGLTWKQEKDWREEWCEQVKAGASRDSAAIKASDRLQMSCEQRGIPMPDELRRSIESFANAHSVPRAAS
jgi:hypothetical protein